MTFDNLQKYVIARIKELVTITVCQEEAGEFDDYPYLIVKFPSADFRIRKRGDYICEVDFWDNTNNKDTIIAQSDALKAGFDYYWQSETGGFYTSFIIFEGGILAGKENMCRIQQRYILKAR
ncbi:MAG: hypothetical protein PVF17_09735 [Ignavibacteria bacterium]|jgi:hypothetical protein